jgi:hypothetical protein
MASLEGDGETTAVGISAGGSEIRNARPPIAAADGAAPGLRATSRRFRFAQHLRDIRRC